jgi:hypothetical protein
LFIFSLFLFACFFSSKVFRSTSHQRRKKKEERKKKKEERKEKKEGPAEERSHQVFVVAMVARNP